MCAKKRARLTAKKRSYFGAFIVHRGAHSIECECQKKQRAGVNGALCVRSNYNVKNAATHTNHIFYGLMHFSLLFWLLYFIVRSLLVFQRKFTRESYMLWFILFIFSEISSLPLLHRESFTGKFWMSHSVGYRTTVRKTDSRHCSQLSNEILFCFLQLVFQLPFQEM